MKNTMKNSIENGMNPTGTTGNGKRKKGICTLMAICFFLYLVFSLWFTLCRGRTPSTERKYSFELFWAYKAYLRGDYEGIYPIVQNIGNIVFFVPTGFLFPAIDRNRRLNGIIVLFGFAFSLLIEVTQYFAGLGTFEIDDLICNSLGAFIGVIIYSRIYEMLSNTKV